MLDNVVHFVHIWHAALTRVFYGAKGSLEAPREPCSFVHNNSVSTYAAAAAWRQPYLPWAGPLQDRCTV